MSARLFVLGLAFLLAGGATAQVKKHIDKAADLPRFSYKLDGKIEDMVRDDAKFKPFAGEVRRDLESVLAQYDIEDKATLRQILGELAQLDMLDGDYQAALARVAQVKALEDKPADKLLSGITTRAIVAGVHASADRTSAAYRAAVAQSIKGELAPIPYDVVANEAKEIKAGTELLGEGRLIGNVREVLQPAVDKNGSLSSDLAPALVRTKYAYNYILPLKPTLVDAWTTYLAAHKVDKPDIWAAGAVTLPASGQYTPVKIAIWDSGVDTKLFPDNLATANGSVPVIAFDRFAEPARGELQAIPDALKSKVPQLKSYLKGFSDLQSNIDSPEASEIKSHMSALKPDEYKAFVEEIGLAGNWMHGTHVAGIAVAGNPYARLVVGRIEFDWHLIPDPCPTRELSLREARNAQSYVDFFRQQGVRVVNMSWGGSVKGIERALELCNIGKTPDERKAIAREYFDHPEGRAHQGFRKRARYPVRHRRGKQQPGCLFRRGHPGRDRASQLAHSRGGRQGRRRSLVHELWPDGQGACQRLSSRERDPGRRKTCRVRDVDGVTAGCEPGREDPRGQSETRAQPGDRADPRQRRQDARRPPHADQPEEDARRRTGGEARLMHLCYRRPNTSLVCPDTRTKVVRFENSRRRRAPT